MRTNLHRIAIAIILTCPVFAADDIQVSTVIGKEFPGAYKHPTTFEELDNGDILLAYY